MREIVTPTLYYALGEIIGRGSFGVVYKATRLIDHKTVAVKILSLPFSDDEPRNNSSQNSGNNNEDKDKNSLLSNEILNELSLLSSMNHPNIVTYYDSFIVKTPASTSNLHEYLNHSKNISESEQRTDLNGIWLIMEYCSGNLLDILSSQSSVTELTIVSILYQLLIGLQYLHSHKIIHRDIKCSNIFLNSLGVVKIGDFGVSVRLACKWVMDDNG